MKRLSLLPVLVLSCSVSMLSQSAQKGPFTVYDISAKVYRIEDSNDSNPPGVNLGEDGQMTQMNNCSDMYLIVGAEKGLLIDLSNKLKMEDETIRALRSLVYERLGGRKLIISLTHRHGDHLGMLPVFVDDTDVKFLLPANEFKEMDRFPEDRTGYFNAGESLDLGGGTVIHTTEVPGHTAHSTIYFLEGKSLVFTGDAIGSGSGVWLFNEDSFYTYVKAIDDLIIYVENPDHQVDPEKLQIYGGHFWQGQAPGSLGARYIYDMKALIEVMRTGKADTEGVSSPMSFLDTNFTYGTATITWNKEAAQRFANSGTE